MLPRDRSYGTIEVLHIPTRRARSSHNSVLCKTCTCLIMMIFILSAAAAFYLVYLVYWVPFFGGSHTSPRPDYSKQKFAVGFDLTAGYGTAAVGFPNGTTINVDQIDGNSRYNQVMAKLSRISSQHPTPPYYGRGYYSDLPRQLHRRMRKAIGLPASQDVAALASILGALKAATENQVGGFHYIFLTIPHLPALYNEDLNDACEYVGLQLLTLPWYVFRAGDQAEWPVTEVNTAMAGNGFGLCEDFRNATHCAEQFKCPEKDNMLSVLYTAEALTAHVGPFCSSMHFYSVGGVANFSLGYQAVSSSTYWPRVRAALRDAFDSYLNRGHEIGLVVAHGEGVISQPYFTTVLQEEVKNAQVDGKSPRLTAKDPIYAAARGAAEFAKRCMLTDIDCIPELAPRGPGW